MNSELAVITPEPGFQEHDLPAGFYDQPFASAFTEFHRRYKTALDLYRGQPLPGLGVRRHGDKDVDHCHGEPTLHIAKVILECGLRRKPQDNPAGIEIRLFDREWRERRAVRCWLTV